MFNIVLDILIDFIKNELVFFILLFIVFGLLGSLFFNKR